MDRDEFFDSLRSETGGAAEEIRRQRQLAYEERTIKRVMDACGLRITSWGRLANHCRRETGQDKMNFAWFNRAFPGFGANLCGRRLPGMHELTIVDLFKPAKQNKLFRRVNKALREFNLDPDDKFLFVFPVVRTPFCLSSRGPVDNEASLTIMDDNRAWYLQPVQNYCAFRGPEWFDFPEL